MIVAASRWLQAGSLTGKAASAATPTRPAARSRRGQRPPVGEVDTAFGQERPEAAPQAVRQHLLGPGLLQAAEGLQRRVGVLDEQHPAGAEGGDHGGQRGVACRHVDENEPGVDEVEGPAGGCAAGDVVLQDLDVGRRRARGP